jgi:hypothetical protein
MKPMAFYLRFENAEYYKRDTDLLPTRHLQMSKKNELKKRENTYSQTSRLENPEGLQLHHNHEKFLFLTVLLLFARCKMNY